MANCGFLAVEGGGAWSLGSARWWGLGSAAPSASGGPVHVCMFRVCCSVLECVGVCCSLLESAPSANNGPIHLCIFTVCWRVLKCAGVCCSLLESAPSASGGPVHVCIFSVCCSMLDGPGACCGLLESARWWGLVALPPLPVVALYIYVYSKCVGVCWSVLECVAVY